MTFHERYLAGCAALAVAALVTVSPTRAQAPTQPQDAALNAEAAQNDWPTYHGTYKSYHYSGLDQINAGNVKNLEVAWMHFPERATRGLQSQPLALDGVLYYSGSYSRVYALDGATGKTIWTYAPETNSVWGGTANPAPLYDWSGADWKKSGPRPGDNLYTTTVIALDPDSGKLKFYHQELPHDAWDFDSAVGEFVMLDRGGKKLVVHANKSGYVFVYDRSNAKVENVWPLVKNINFVKSIDPKTGELIGRRDLVAGKADSPLCPAIAGGISWNSGAYSPKTQLYYKIGQEWCMDLTVEKTNPILEPMAQLNIGAQFKLVAPPDGPARGHLDARDPVTGVKKWEVNYKAPPLASVLATAGNLVFVPDAEGVVHAYNADSGQELWSHNNGMGHNAGIISYMAGGKQYIAVPAGWGSLVSDEYVALYGEPFKSMAKNTGALVVFALK